MSARTCLLCGKPLSRIWVGAGDDFCSREHGNQYRLKRGMDRLTETNKVSILMRRRENLRPIASASLPLDSAASRRDFPEVRISAAGETRFPFLRPLSVSSTMRISPVSERYVAPHLPRPAGSSQPRQPDSSLLRFSARKTAPVAPARRAASPVRVPRVRAALLRDRIVGTGSEHRGFGAFRPAGIRAHAGSAGIAPSRIEPPGAACFRNAQCPRGIEASPRTDSPRGLSRGFGFRRPARRSAVCACPLKAHVVVASLASPARRFRYLRETRNGPAAPRAMGRRIATREPVWPLFLARVSIAGIKWPGAVRIGRRRPCLGYAPAVREWGPLWNLSAPAGFPHPRRSLAAPERGMATPCVVALPLAPVRSNGAPHVALAPFAPQNSSFGYKEYQEK
jgi:hypothetical protein